MTISLEYLDKNNFLRIFLEFNQVKEFFRDNGLSNFLKNTVDLLANPVVEGNGRLLLPEKDLAGQVLISRTFYSKLLHA